jgi:hypothetical protein
MTDNASGSSAPGAERPATAIFMPKTNENGEILSGAEQRNNKVTVHFNPEFLDITFTNSIQQGKRNQPAQVSETETTAKLSMELVFDTTLTGLDVRTETNKLIRMMNPTQERPRRNNNNRQIPSIVIFQWGTIWFEGYIDSYREKIDFFSIQGVPLRATVTLSMTQQERKFEPRATNGAKNNLGGDLSPANNPALNRSNAPIKHIGFNISINDALRAGNLSASGSSALARSVAMANSVENMRLPEVKELVIPDFPLPATPQFDFTFSAASTGAGAQLAGGTAGLFADLKKTSKSSSGAALSLGRESHFSMDGQGMDAEASFALGGGLDGGGSASMSADVGVSADIELGIRFKD